MFIPVPHCFIDCCFVVSFKVGGLQILRAWDEVIGAVRGLTYVQVQWCDSDCLG